MLEAEKVGVLWKLQGGDGTFGGEKDARVVKGIMILLLYCMLSQLYKSCFCGVVHVQHKTVVVSCQCAGYLSGS